MVCVFKQLYCSAKLSMSKMEKRYRNKIIISHIFKPFIKCFENGLPVLEMASVFIEILGYVKNDLDLWETPSVCGELRYVLK